ncbi:NAD-dependent dehydratase, partial [candidate division KSB1 bacterium]|nr:NAD-dependent dehydratase [candidate division KSB1 bacterium]NIV70840.1 NAD-dependent dehydratase [Phycisphaerae bacterium]NIS25186.1 NAD-dependent dehydratase [candidate division KSB1 bacterium]NIU25889.1 NAD-dependent dehydratase [candidate division KSB1 bacterium]NIU94289.1 NAD-dependent dehydratase [candidate division KSB1 bacterium]
WHIPSAETLTTRQFLNLVSGAAGTKLKIRSASKFFVSVLGIFSPIMRELKEMMYQWENDYVVDHSKFMNTFEFETTPHAEAIRRTLDWYRQKL